MSGMKHGSKRANIELDFYSIQIVKECVLETAKMSRHLFAVT